MKLHINLEIKKLLRYKYFLISALVSLLISVILILQYKYFVFRGTPIREVSIFSTTFLKGCFQCGCLWLYLGVVVYLFIRFFRFLFRSAKALIERVKSGSLSIKRILLHVVIMAAIVGLTFVWEYIYGHFIIGEKTSAGSYFNRYHFLFFLCIAFVIYFIFLYYNKIIRKFEHLFVVLMLLIGCCYSFGLPNGMISWDDAIHYQRALNASKLTECATSEAEYMLMAGSVPATYEIAEIDEWEELLNTSDDIVHADARSYRSYFYQYISYLPSGLVMSIARAVNLPFMLIYRLGRLANLIMYTLIIYYAMKRLKSGKAILAVIAMFPINMFLATCYSYDWFLTAMCMLGFSYLIAEFQNPDETITRKNALIMVLSFFFGIGTKAIYFPLLLLCLLLPKKKFSSAKASRNFRLLVVAATLISVASFALPFISSSGASGTDTRGGDDVNALEQVKYALTHPLTYAKTLFGFLFKDFLNLKNTSGYTCSFAYLGSSSYFTHAMMLLTGACLTDHNKFDQTVLTKKFRITTLVISGITIILFASAMYAAFTPVGADTINGCQQRYLEAVIFPIAFCFGSSRLSSEFPARLKYTLISSCGAFILFGSIWQMCISQYF